MAQKKRKSQSLLNGALVLSVSTLLVKIIGVIYKIPISNMMGAVGRGYFDSAYNLYIPIYTISMAGLPVAVSKMVSAKISQKRYKSAYKIFRCSMTVSICTGGIAALFVYFGADWIEAKFFSKYSGIAVPLRVLAPTIFIVAVMGVFRGLFQGHRTMLPTAISQIFEQVVNAFVSVGAAYFFMRAHSASPKLPAWGAAGGTLGTCIGAVTALIILLFIYMMYRPVMRKQAKRDRVTTGESLVQTYKIIFVTVVPIILSQTVYQLSGIIDVTIFNNVMGTLGYSDKVVKTLQGIYSTKYRLLVSVPIAVSTAIASSMIPNLVSSVAAGDMADARKKTDMAIKFNMIIAFPSAMGLAVLARPIITLLFPSSDINTGSMMMLIGSSCVIFYALSTVTSGVLQSIDKMGLPVIHSLVSLIIHIVFVYVLLRWTSLGVYALVLGNVTYPLVVCFLNGRSVAKYMKYKQETTRTFCVPLLASFVMGIATYAVYKVFVILTSKVYIAIFPALVVAVSIYFALVLKMHGLSRKELYEFPMGRRMAKVADKFHLLG